MESAIKTAVLVLLIIAVVIVVITVVYSIIDARRSLKVGTHGSVKHARTAPAPIKMGETTDGHQEVGAPDEVSRGRFLLLGAIVAGTLGVLFVKLWSMQVLSSDAYDKLAESNYTSSFGTRAPRGRILDRNGKVLVGNRATLAIVARADIVDDRAMIHRLSNVLGIPYAAVKQRLENTSEGAQADRLVTSDAPTRAVAFIEEHPQIFDGISIEERTVRTYPYGQLAAHLLGYTGSISEEELAESTTPDGLSYVSGDVVGKTGVEAQYESTLQGVRGTKTVQVDASGNVLSVIDEVAPQPGNDIHLTIDVDIQQACEDAIQVAISAAAGKNYLNADAGAAIVLDLEDNGVLGMASFPTFSPSEFTTGISDELWETMSSEESNYPLTNRAIAGLYPSASTIKPFSAMAALKLGYADAGTTSNCTGVWTALGEEWAKKCWLTGGHGTLGIVEGIAVSCDVVFYDLSISFYRNEENPNSLQDEYVSWGLGQSTGIDIPGELAGRIPTAEWKAEYNADVPEEAQWNPGDTANIIIGQGDVLITPIENAAAYSGLANGLIYRPHVLLDVVGADGGTVIRHNPEVLYQPEYSDDHISLVREGILEQVQRNSNFYGFPYDTLGKTGTGQVTAKDDLGWYVGYGPADAPKYLVAVCIEQAGSSGATSVAARHLFAKCLGVEEDDTGLTATETRG